MSDGQDGVVATHHLRVTRSARYCTLGDPAASVREIWIACHGYSQLAPRFIRHFRGIAAPHRLVVAPEALSRFYLEQTLPHGPDARIGATWMTREDRDAEIADYVEYLDTLAAELMRGRDAGAVRLVAFGFSQGVATVFRWLGLGRTRVHRVIAWSGGLPHDLDLAAVATRLPQPVTCVFGDADQFFDEAGVVRQVAALHAAGIRHHVVRFAGTHVVDNETLIRVADGPLPG